MKDLHIVFIRYSSSNVTQDMFVPLTSNSRALKFVANKIMFAFQSSSVIYNFFLQNQQSEEFLKKKENLTLVRIKSFCFCI